MKGQGNEGGQRLRGILWGPFLRVPYFFTSASLSHCLSCYRCCGCFRVLRTCY